MGLINPFMNKIVIGSGDLELEAKAGTSLLVKDIKIYNPATNYITVSIERETVGYFRVGGSLGNQLPISNQILKHSHPLVASGTGSGSTLNHIKIKDADGTAKSALIGLYDATSITVDKAVQYEYLPKSIDKTIINYMRTKGWLRGYPIAEGEKLTITGAQQTGSIQIVEYEEYEAGDIKNTDPNGSKSDNHIYILYGQPSGNITTAGDHEIVTNINPRPFPKFPFADKVPANTEIELLGLLSSEVMDLYSSSDYVRTKYLKLYKEEEVLFDKDKNGLLFYGIGQGIIDRDDIATGVSVIGGYSTIDNREPFLFNPSLIFKSGEQLVTYVTTETSSSVSNSEIAKANLEIGYIVRYKKV